MGWKEMQLEWTSGRVDGGEQRGKDENAKELGPRFLLDGGRALGRRRSLQGIAGDCSSRTEASSPCSSDAEGVQCSAVQRCWNYSAHAARTVNVNSKQKQTVNRRASQSI